MGASEILLNAVFYTMAAIALVGAYLVAASRNIVRSAFALLAVRFAVAAMYAIMKADFIAAAQVLIYVGGILVLIIFAIMLTHRITDVKLSNDSTPSPAAFCACLCLLFSLVVVILPVTTRWKTGSEETVARAGAATFTLLQWQGDGTTGLARGGNAFEGEVVVGVRGVAPQGATTLRILATSPASKDGVEKTVSVEAGKAGEWKIPLSGLAEGAWTWTARFMVGNLAAVGDSDGRADFNVYRGVTKPAALALAGPYLFAFEVVSVLLLAALVGAAFLARKEVKE